ncbi:hypothetical protein [Streptomyces sp. NPDC052701]|uniref:hypothetical protein n=1 Tax=Streptomyces sp. NPDC052701 TaxID=3155533 RepID=UPI00341337AE
MKRRLSRHGRTPAAASAARSAREGFDVESTKPADTVRQLRGDDDAVRRWFGAGTLDNLVAMLGPADIDEPWARVLTAR